MFLRLRILAGGVDVPVTTSFGGLGGGIQYATVSVAASRKARVARGLCVDVEWRNELCRVVCTDLS